MDKRKILFVGAGEAGMHALGGTIRALKNFDKEKDYPTYDIYLVHSPTQTEEQLSRIIAPFGRDKDIVKKIHFIRRDIFKEEIQCRVDDNIFDYICITAGKKDFEGTSLEKKIMNSIKGAGFDIEGADYRYKELALNYKLICDLALDFKYLGIKGLYDIFTNPPDPFAYLWAGILEEVYTVMGNNHLDTHRMRTVGSNEFDRVCLERFGKQSGEDLPDLTGICAGYHGGGISPLIKGYPMKVDRETDTSFLNSREFYQILKQNIIDYSKIIAKTSEERRKILRGQITNPFEDITTAILDKKREVGMSIFQKLSENPCLVPEQQARIENDQGIYFGWGTKFQRVMNGYIWRKSDPPNLKMQDFAADDLIDNYNRLHRLIDDLVDKSEMVRVVDKPVKTDSVQEQILRLYGEKLVDPSTGNKIFVVIGDSISKTRPVDVEEPDLREVKPTIHYIDSFMPGIIQAFELPHLKRVAKHKIQVDTHKYSGKLIPLKLAFDQNRMYVACNIKDRLQQSDKYTHLLWYDLHQNVEGSLIPAGNMRFSHDGKEVLLAYKRFVATDTMETFDGDLYFLIRSNTPDQKCVRYNVESDIMEVLGARTGKEPIFSIARTQDGLVFGGKENFYRMDGNKFRKIAKNRCIPFSMHGVDDRNVVMYSDGRSTFMFNTYSNRSHKEVDLNKAVIYSNDEIIVTGIKDDHVVLRKYENERCLFSDKTSLDDKINVVDVERVVVPDHNSILLLDNDGNHYFDIRDKSLSRLELDTMMLSTCEVYTR